GGQPSAGLRGQPEWPYLGLRGVRRGHKRHGRGRQDRRPAHSWHWAVRRRRAQPAGGDRGCPGGRRSRTCPGRTRRHHAQALETQRPQTGAGRLMGTLFIADLHLDDSRPQITTLLERYLASDEVRRADALYILGDLVEAWIGDDDDAELPRRIAA